MEINTTLLLSRIMLLLPRLLFWGSFAIGTMILIAFLVTGSDALIDLGLAYTGIAFLINFLAMIVLSVYANMHGHYSSRIQKRTAHMLWNIPITIIYFIIVIKYR